MKKLLSVLVVLMLIAGLFAGCAPAAEEPAPPEEEPPAEEPAEPEPEPLKVGLVLSGPINDGGWNSVAYEGLMKAQDELGIEGNYIENVPQSDNEEAFRNYAVGGYDVVIGHGYQFNDAAIALGPEFPDVKFVVTSSAINQAPNVAGLEVSNVEAGFIGGMLAGAFTKTKSVGFVGGVEMPPITDAERGFAKAVEMIDPDIKVGSALIGSWDDVVAAKSVATEFINNGADVVLGDANQAGLGVIEAAQEKGVYAIGFSYDQSSVAPETVIASSKYDLGVGITFILKEIMEGRFEAKHYLLGTTEGATGVIWNKGLKSSLDQDLVALVDEMEQKLISKEIDTTTM